MFCSPKECPQRTVVKRETGSVQGRLAESVSVRGHVENRHLRLIQRTRSCHMCELPAPHSREALKDKPKWRVTPCNGCPSQGCQWWRARPVSRGCARLQDNQQSTGCFLFFCTRDQARGLVVLSKHFAGLHRVLQAWGEDSQGLRCPGLGLIKLWLDSGRGLRTGVQGFWRLLCDSDIVSE